MDRRLPIRPDTYTAQMARRELYLEQRLDQLGRYRPRSQRFLNPPCCADTPVWTLAVFGWDGNGEPSSIFAGLWSDGSDLGYGGGDDAAVTIESVTVTATGISDEGAVLTVDLGVYDGSTWHVQGSLDMIANPTGGVMPGFPAAVSAGGVLALMGAMVAGDGIVDGLRVDVVLSGPGDGEYLDDWTTPL